MANVSSTLSSMASTLRDNGAGGHFADSVDLAAKTGVASDISTPAFTPDSNPRNVWINNKNSDFTNPANLAWDAAHESGHGGAGLADQSINGVFAYKYFGVPERAVFDALPSTDSGKAMQNPDTLVNYSW